MTKRTIDNTLTPKDMLDDITDAQPKILHAGSRAQDCKTGRFGEMVIKKKYFFSASIF